MRIRMKNTGEVLTVSRSIGELLIRVGLAVEVRVEAKPETRQAARR